MQDPLDTEAYRIYQDCIGEEYATLEQFEEAYCGCHESEQAYCEEFLDDTQPKPETPQEEFMANYFDIEAYTRDVFLGDCWSERSTEGTHVFRNI